MAELDKWSRLSEAALLLAFLVAWAVFRAVLAPPPALNAAALLRRNYNKKFSNKS